MSFFGELKRRNVVRVGLAYAVVAWIVAQVSQFMFESFGAPAWVLQVLVALLVLGSGKRWSPTSGLPAIRLRPDQSGASGERSCGNNGSLLSKSDPSIARRTSGIGGEP